MSYSIIVPKTPFTANEVKVRGSYLEKNKLWKINEGELLLHFGGGEFDFQREVGLDSFSERVTYAAFASGEFNQIVQHFFQKGELRYIDFYDLDEDLQDELRFLLGKLQVGSEKELPIVSAFMEEYMSFVNDFAGEPWYITLNREKTQVNLYPNGVMYATFHYGTKTDDLVLELYAEIFELLGKPFALTPVSIVEKETTNHPLKNSHAYLTELLNLAGETAREQANLSKEEAEKINKLLLKYTKDFENKRVYKS